jgi:uncharacterized protein (DUF2384 family)
MINDMVDEVAIDAEFIRIILGANKLLSGPEEVAEWLTSPNSRFEGLSPIGMLNFYRGGEVLGFIQSEIAGDNCICRKT